MVDCFAMSSINGRGVDTLQGDTALQSHLCILDLAMGKFGSARSPVECKSAAEHDATVMGCQHYGACFGSLVREEADAELPWDERSKNGSPDMSAALMGHSVLRKALRQVLNRSSLLPVFDTLTTRFSALISTAACEDGLDLLSSTHPAIRRH